MPAQVGFLLDELRIAFAEPGVPRDELRPLGLRKGNEERVVNGVPAVDSHRDRPVPERGRRDRPRHERFGIVENFQTAGKGKTRSCDVLPDDIRKFREEEVGDDDLICLVENLESPLPDSGDPEKGVRQDIRVDDGHLRPASIHAST